MKIGILTFHRAVNYGAFMQSFALSTRIAEMFPEVSVEIIDYNPVQRERFKRKCPIVFLHRRSIREGIQKYIQTLVFERSMKRLSLGKRLLSVSYSTLKKYIETEYDIVIVGSDAVFNWNDIGLPNAYFLTDINIKYKMTYAASSHLQKYHDVSSEEQNILEKALNEFCFIGVRDTSTFAFVRQILPSCDKIYHNCDPSIFLKMDFPENQLIPKLRKHKFNFEKKTVFLMLMHPQYAKYARKYFGDNVQYVSLMDGNKEADIYLYDLDPFEWAHVFKYGSFLITDYFHGTIFGLKNCIPVLSIDASEYSNSNGYESKARDLLFTRLNLSEMYVSSKELNGENGYQVFSTCIKRIENVFNKKFMVKQFELESKSFNCFEESLKSILGYK